jgi:hypothetical protein
MGWIVVIGVIIMAVIPYALCVAAGKCDEQMGIK